MDARTAEALEKSIEHWRENAEGEIEKATTHGGHCALCLVFARHDCDGCPVADGDHENCKGTPYWSADAAFHRWRKTPTPETEAAFRAAAREELAFLESLREEK
jgi:hypothetical protein